MLQFFLFNENKKRTGRRLKLFKKNNGNTSSDTIQFATPLETTYAQCVFVINAQDSPETSHTIIELPPYRGRRTYSNNKHRRAL